MYFLPSLSGSEREITSSSDILMVLQPSGVKGRLKDGISPHKLPTPNFSGRNSHQQCIISEKVDHLQFHVHILASIIAKCSLESWTQPALRINLKQKHEERWNSASSCTGFKVWLADREFCAQLAARIVFALIFFHTHNDNDNSCERDEHTWKN